MRFLGQISGAKHEVMVEIARELTQARIYISPNEIMNRSYYESPPAIPRNIDIRALTRKLKNRVNKRNSRTHTQSSHEYSFTLSEGTRASLTRLSERLNKNSSETISNLIDRAEKHQQLLSSEVFTTKKAKKALKEEHCQTPGMFYISNYGAYQSTSTSINCRQESPALKNLKRFSAHLKTPSTR